MTLPRGEFSKDGDFAEEGEFAQNSNFPRRAMLLGRAALLQPSKWTNVKVRCDFEPCRIHNRHGWLLKLLLQVRWHLSNRRDVPTLNFVIVHLAQMLLPSRKYE